MAVSERLAAGIPWHLGRPEELGYEAWNQLWADWFRDTRLMGESTREIDVGETQTPEVEYYERRGGDTTMQIPKDIAAKRWENQEKSR